MKIQKKNWGGGGGSGRGGGVGWGVRVAGSFFVFFGGGVRSGGVFGGVTGLI